MRKCDRVVPVPLSQDVVLPCSWQGRQYGGLLKGYLVFAAWRTCQARGLEGLIEVETGGGTWRARMGGN